MKVQNIEIYQAKDGSDRWKVTFKDSEYPLIADKQPTFEEGHEIPGDKLRLIQKGQHTYFVWAVRAKRQPQAGRSYGRSPDQAASIETQVVWKGLVELLIAGKLDELIESKNHLAMGIRRYAERRLVQDLALMEDEITHD